MSEPGAERRIPLGPLAGLAGALLLVVSLLLDWWDGVSAFTAFEVLDLVLAALAVGSIAVFAIALGARLPGFEPGRGVALGLAALAFLIVVSQALNDPPAIAGSGRGPAAGLWLALGGSLLLLAGGVLAAARISLALDPEQGGARTPAPDPPEPAAARMRRRAAARAAAARTEAEPVAAPEAPSPGDGREP